MVLAFFLLESHVAYADQFIHPKSHIAFKASKLGKSGECDRYGRFASPAPFHNKNSNGQETVMEKRLASQVLKPILIKGDHLYGAMVTEG